MNKSGFSALIFIILIPVIAGVAFLILRNYIPLSQVEKVVPLQNFANNASEGPKDINIEPAGENNSVCHDSPKYFVIESYVEGSVGTNFLVKYKKTPEQKIPCLYTFQNNDFEIKNEWAEYFQELTGDFLILDSGTGPPPRGLIIYSLAERKKVFTDSYNVTLTDNSGFQDQIVDGNTLTYWSPINTEPTLQSCPELDKYTQWGFGAGVEAYVSVDLNNPDKKELGEYRCMPRQ